MENTRTVLITGASSGIGSELAHLFAKDGHHLVLTGKHDDKLQAVAAELREKYNVQVDAIAQDLGIMNGAQQLYDALAAADLTHIDVLVNDAGLGAHGNFNEVPWERYSEIIHVNIVAITQLTKLIVPQMIERKSGKILNVASIASFLAGPKLSVYHASKSYVLSFSLALAEELEKHDITVTALCPGATDTNFDEVAGMENTRIMNSPAVMDPLDVAQAGYKALMNGERIEIAGIRNKLSVEFLRILPEAWATKISEFILDDKK